MNSGEAHTPQEVPIIHGKRTGNLRRSVHALLERKEHVASYRLAGDRRSPTLSRKNLNLSEKSAYTFI